MYIVLSTENSEKLFKGTYSDCIEYCNTNKNTRLITEDAWKLISKISQLSNGIEKLHRQIKELEIQVYK